MTVKIKHIQKKSPEQENMCAGCDIYCCTLTVNLTCYDILRIITTTKKPMAEFIDVRYSFDGDPYAFMLNGGLFKMVLQQGPNGCIFFDRSKELRCGIEECKPSICLAYPLVFKDGKAVLREDVVCPSQNKQKIDHAKMSPQILFDCSWELDRYKEIVGDWNLANRDDRTLIKFLIFSGDEMDLEGTPWGAIYRKIKRSFIKRPMAETK